MTGSPSPLPRLPPQCCPADSVARRAGAAAPETSTRIDTHIAGFVKISRAALVALALTACTETGDFGRPKPSLWNDIVLPATGSLAAQARGEPVSRYAYTDNEDELRDRAWRFVMPAHERSRFDAVVANLVRTRILPVGLHPADRTEYHRALMSESFRSPASRYRRLAEDAVADLKLIAPFAQVAARVMAADGVRLRSLAHVRELDEGQIYHALARVAENRCLIGWVRYETQGRLDSYRYALEHLVIEAPENAAIDAERSLTKLEVHRQTLDALLGPPLTDALCAGVEGELYVQSATGILPGPGPLVVKN